MKVKPNCVNCGAPLHGDKCEYCGTEYDFSDVMKIQYEVSEIPLQTVTCRMELPYEIATIDGIETKVKHDMVNQLAEGILPYTDFKTWIDPKRMTQVIGAKIKVGVLR